MQDITPQLKEQGYKEYRSKESGFIGWSISDLSIDPRWELVNSHCPRCILDYEDHDRQIRKGIKRKSECTECGVCRQCEHLIECSKSN